jgi:CRP/FNR family transcriptional regulator, polysaccharide utilization system transcription regulator
MMDLDQFELPALNTLTSEQTEKLKDQIFIVRHRIGEEVFSQGKPISHLMFLTKGLVKIYKNDLKKRSVILSIIGPGKYVGIFSAFYNNLYQFTATALEDSEIVFINLQVVHEILAENGQFAIQLIRHFSIEGMDIMNKLAYYPQKQVPGRIAEVLLTFSIEVYKSDQFTIPLSRQELAELVFSTKESVSRTLTEFKNDRMIDIHDRQVTLLSIELLKTLSRLG